MTDTAPWQIRRVWFPFRENPHDGKFRPVVIKDVLDDGCVVIYVTSKIDRARYSDFYLLQDWADEGLDRPSAVGWKRMLKIPKSELGDCIGVLSPVDRLELQMHFRLHR